jgi:hypothetical protein
MKYLFIILFCYSCGEDSFKKVEKVQSFRVLGIIADLPEVAPGATVNLSPIISDIKGTDPTITGRFVACIDPGISRGALVNCDHDAAAVSGNYNIIFATLLPNADARTGLSDPLSITVPSTILTGRSSRDEFNGVGYIVIFNFTVSGKSYTSFKRIVATNRAILNANPVAANIMINGLANTVAPINGDKLTLSSGSAPEIYEVINVDGVQESLTEDYQIAWYTDQGTFTQSKVSIDEITEYEGNSASHLTLALLRDERGGLDFLKIYYP